MNEVVEQQSSKKLFYQFVWESVLIVKTLLEVMNRVTRYKMLTTQHGCLLLVFYLPARNMCGKHVKLVKSFVQCVHLLKCTFFDKENTGSISRHILKLILSSVFLVFLAAQSSILAEFNVLGKARKDGKANLSFGKKRICDASFGKFIFLILCVN